MTFYQKALILLGCMSLVMLVLWPHSYVPVAPLKVVPVTLVTPDGRNIALEVEVALTIGQQRKGLMGRRTLPDGKGMLFVYNKPRYISMWMKNTQISLDMIFFDEHKKVNQIEANTRVFSEKIIQGKYPSVYVLEVPGGYAKKYAITTGTKLIY